MIASACGDNSSAITAYLAGAIVRIRRFLYICEEPHTTNCPVCLWMVVIYWFVNCWQGVYGFPMGSHPYCFSRRDSVSLNLSYFLLYFYSINLVSGEEISDDSQVKGKARTFLLFAFVVSCGSIASSGKLGAWERGFTVFVAWILGVYFADEDRFDSPWPGVALLLQTTLCLASFEGTSAVC